MYESFYGMKEKTFNLNPDPDYLYMSQGHENAYTHLEYAIAENKGFVVITGEIGSGKTTLINYLLYNLQLDIQIGLINNTNIAPSQFLRMICREFEIELNGKDKVEAMDAFQDFLLKKYSEKKRVLLIIDEAQNLSPKTMEEVRMLSNLEAEKHHLIQMILVGQPELKYKLQRNDMQQFAQRVTVHCHLEGLSQDEVGEYIRHRLKVGEADNLDLFDNEAIDAIYENSGGIPRLINILCDTALVYGFADGIKVIDKSVLETVIEEREASGIFLGINQGEKEVLHSLSGGGAVSATMDDRFLLMERQIQLLEEKLNWFTNNQEKRDTIVIELIKMLKKSMESRKNFISKFKKINKKPNITKINARENIKDTNPSNISVLKKKTKEI